MIGYYVEITEHAFDQGAIRKSLHGQWRDGTRQPLDIGAATHRAWHINAAQGLMLLVGSRSHVLTARVVVA